MSDKPTPSESIPLALIDPSPLNPRKTFDQAKLQELAESIKSHGVLQPILVRPFSRVVRTGPFKGAHEAYQLVAGERRWRAAKLAGLTHIPASVRDLSDEDAVEIAVIENDQREDVTPLERARGYQMLIDKGRKVEDLAAKIGRSAATVYGLLKLLHLPEKAIKAVEAGELPVASAQLIGRLPNDRARKEVAEHALRKDWQGQLPSYRQIKELIGRQFMIELKQAPFRQDDAQLVAEAGSCKDCPKRTGNNRVEYPDGRADVCTDPECYRGKVKAWQGRVQQEAEADGQKVIAGKEAEKLFPHGNSLKHDAPYFDLAEQCYEHPKHKSYKQLVGEDLKDKVILAFDREGNLHRLVPRDAALPILREKHKVHKNSWSTVRTSDEEKRDRARRMLEGKIRRETNKAMLAQIRAATESVFASARQDDAAQNQILRAVCRRLLCQILGERREWIQEAQGLDKKGDLEDVITCAGLGRLAALAAQLVAAQDVIGWDYGNHFSSNGESLLSSLGISKKAVGDEVKRKIKEEKATKKAGKKPLPAVTQVAPGVSIVRNGTPPVNNDFEKVLAAESDADAKANAYAWRIEVAKHGQVETETVIYVAKNEQAARRKAFLISRVSEIRECKPLTREEYLACQQAGECGHPGTRHSKTRYSKRPPSANDNGRKTVLIRAGLRPTVTHLENGASEEVVEVASEFPRQHTEDEVMAEDGACHGCGCTDDDCRQCVEATGSPCYWVEPGLCSACVAKGWTPFTEEGKQLVRSLVRANVIRREKREKAGAR